MKHAITAPTPGDAIAACFGNPATGRFDQPACTVIGRNTASGALDGDPTQVSGPVPAAQQPRPDQDRRCRCHVRLSSQPRHDHERTGEAGAGVWRQLDPQPEVPGRRPHVPTSVNRECAGFYSANCGFPSGQLLPKYTFNSARRCRSDVSTCRVLWRYMSKMRYEALAKIVARGSTMAPAAALVQLLFSGTINSRPASSVFFGAPGTFNGKTVNFNHIPAVELFRLRHPVQRQRAFRPDVLGREHLRQEAADRGQHGRFDFGEQRQHLPGDLRSAGPPLHRGCTGQVLNRTQALKGERRAFGSASFLLGGRRWRQGIIRRSRIHRVARYFRPDVTGSPACSARGSRLPSAPPLPNTSTSPAAPRTSSPVFTKRVAPPS